MAAGVPEGYSSVTPYLIVEGAEDLLVFMQAAFDGNVRTRMNGPDGAVAHAEVVIGGSVVMVGGASGEDTTTAGIHLYVSDCDATYQRALEAGATSVSSPEDQFYGDRMAGVRDASGTTWWIATRVENVTPEEMAKRSEEMARRGS